MASSQTANLALCQWTADDPVLRADFNADNQKLDAALGGMALVRLMSVTTQTEVNTIELNLTGISLDQFCELQLRVRLRHYCDPGSMMCFRMLLNNVTVADAYWTASIAGSSAAPSSAAAINLDNLSIHAGDDSGLLIRLTLTPTGIGTMAEGFGNGAAVHWQGGTNTAAGVTGANLSRITFYDNSLGNTAYRFAAGGTIYLYGVRK